MSVLRPSDQVPYFDTRETHVTAPIGSSIQAVPADPHRVVLILGVSFPGGNTFGAFTDTANATKALSVPSNFPLVLTQGTHGPLVNRAWFVTAQGANTDVYVLEMLLNRYPSDEMKGLSP